MRRALAAALCGLLLASCASTATTVSQAAERADITASTLYAAVADAANAYELTAGADVAKAEALKLRAWKLLQDERAAYAAGQTFDLTALGQLVVQAQALGR